MTSQTTEPSLAIPKQPLSRTVIYQTIGYFAIFIGLGMTAASLGPTLPGLAAHTGSTLSQISFLFTGRAFGYLLGSLRGGRAFDRLPGHTLLVFLIAGMGIMLALVPVSARLWLLTVLLFVLGLFEGATDVGGNTLLVWVHQQRVGPYMNALHFFFGVGAFFSPIIAAQALLRTNNINWVYWLLAIYMVPVALWIVRLPSPKSPHDVQTQLNGDTTTRIANPTLVGILTLFFILYVGAESGFGGWIFTYATTLDLATPATAAYLTSVFWGVFTIGRLFGIPLAVRFKPQTMLVWDLAGCLISMIVILLYPGSLLALAIGAGGLGLSMASMFPNMLVYAEQRMPLSGRITRWFFVGAGVGGMILPWLLGQIFVSIGPQAIMWAILLDLIMIVGIFIVLWLYNRPHLVRRQSNAV